MQPVHAALQSAAEADRVQVVRDDLVGAGDEILDVVVLRVEVAAGERVRAAGCEHANEPRRELGRRPGRVVAEPARSSRSARGRAEEEDRDAAARARWRASRRSGRPPPCSPGTPCARDPGQVRGAAARDDDAPAPALEHARDDGAAGEVRAEHVDLEHVPPVVDRHLPGRAVADCRCRRSRRAGRSARAPPRCVAPSARRRRCGDTSPTSASPPISRGDRLDLLGASAR